MYENKVMQAQQYAVAAAPATPDISPIEGATNSLTYEQEITAGILGDLHARLSVILRPAAPTNEKVDQLGRAAHSQLHGRLNEFTSRQEGFNASLRGLLDRLTI